MGDGKVLFTYALSFYLRLPLTWRAVILLLPLPFLLAHFVIIACLCVCACMYVFACKYTYTYLCVHVFVCVSAIYTLFHTAALTLGPLFNMNATVDTQ